MLLISKLGAPYYAVRPTATFYCGLVGQSLTQDLHNLITSDKRGGNVTHSVCLSVCL